MQGRDLMNGLETISFSAPIDLNKLLVAVNFYSGSAQNGVSGEVRLSVDGRTYAKGFEIDADGGNRAAELADILKSGSAPNDAWTVIDPVSITQD